MLAVTVCVSLTGLYWGFRLATSPFLDVERKKLKTSIQSREPGPEFQKDAVEWFAEKSWVRDAKKHFRDKGSYLFCNNFDLNAGRTRIDVSPIAVLWRPESDEEEAPITLLADSAMLGSSGSLLSEDSEIGEVTEAQLAGNVIIRGPNNLLIRGHSFQLDRKSMKLWSSSRIDFQWETHQGFATSGIEIQLESDKPDGGLTDITGVGKMQLMGRVVCDISVPPERRGEKGIDLQVFAPNGFSYDVPLKQAVFRGRVANDLSRPLNEKEEVVVLRKNPLDPLERPDKLVCTELVLQLQEKIDATTGLPIEDELTLNVFRAWGRRIRLTSPENDLELHANRLRYFVEDRRLEIEMVASGSIVSELKIRKETTSLVLPPTQSGDTPQIVVLHSADDTIQRVECSVPESLYNTPQGRGRLTSVRAAKPSEESINKNAFDLRAEWGKSLLIQLAPDETTRIVRLDGKARVVETVRKFGLAADTIAVKLVEDKTPPATTQIDGPVKTVSVARPVDDSSLTSFDFSKLTPEIMTAVGNVALKSEEGNGRLREKLTVEFTSQTPESNGTPESNDPSADRSLTNRLTDDEGNRGSVTFGADTLKASVVIGDKRKMSFRDVWLNGAVSIARKSDKPAEDFVASGNQLYASGGLANQHEIQLFGDPAKVISSSGELEGQQIDLNEVGQNAKVVGSGSITFQTDKGFSFDGDEAKDSEKLETPIPIDIYWTDHMVFRKKSAKFVGNIRVSMIDETGQKLSLQCAGLTVYFNEDVALGSRDGQGSFETYAARQSSEKKQAGRIERIECHSKVTVTIDQQSDGVPSGRLYAVFADLDVNLMNGDFNAIGPGIIESVTPDKKGQLQGTPPVTARANAAAQTTETAFVYMQVEFIGELIGNLERKEAKLSQNVVAVVTPARRVDEKIDLQIVSTENLPVRAGILRAETLSISSVESPTDRQKVSYAIVARDNASLESQRISARADTINYDSSKEQFIMRADGNGKVTVVHRSGGRGKFNRFNGKRFEYYGRTNDLRGDGINGLDVSNFQTGSD